MLWTFFFSHTVMSFFVVHSPSAESHQHYYEKRREKINFKANWQWYASQLTIWTVLYRFDAKNFLSPFTYSFFSLSSVCMCNMKWMNWLCIRKLTFFQLKESEMCCVVLLVPSSHTLFNHELKQNVNKYGRQSTDFINFSYSFLVGFLWEFH